MPVCQSFQIVLHGDVEDILRKVRNRFQELGVRFSGYSESGDFSGGGIEGNYTVSGKVVTINITSFDCPASMVYSCANIEEIIRNYLQ